jgi:hypothetical protein
MFEVSGAAHVRHEEFTSLGLHESSSQRPVADPSRVAAVALVEDDKCKRKYRERLQSPAPAG